MLKELLQWYMYMYIVALFDSLTLCWCVFSSSIGNVLCSVESPAKVTNNVEARIIVFSIEIPITNGYPVSQLYYVTWVAVVVMTYVCTYNVLPLHM